MKKKRLYKKFHQVMDYVLPLVVLLIVFRPALPLVAKIILATMVLLSLFVSIRTYRLSYDGQNFYVNNLFVNKTIPLQSIRVIEPAPFYYGATSGRVAEKGFRIRYLINGREQKKVVLVSKRKEIQEIWDKLRENIGRKV
ncbi:MAG: hypothetical protein ACXWB9_03405 [Flavisolibacter sp.]